ncbi:mannosyl-oligosaccharide glucosidase [Coniosporium apollinis CBS 100218]|uniref:Mannosyl-oligosaccharide glucosidase n=1 Tax=Coniosporium apollinis (strain CBS 100218) TaxID=1168221 RepID=R7YI56_CONA1|nr:mannosyl-oligosaccharide glucosidase [Coniosporium apollinis CBS 100218]EON61568.1 mannosyl-oligosaccharide glucosidase [Coniosporium apollinis CBS 100218]
MDWSTRIPPLLVVLFALCSLLLFGQANGAEEGTASTTEIEKALNQSLLWGPYRPNLYFGVRPRIPKSLMTGLLWARVEDFTTVQHNFRHTCEQHEGMAGYGWDEYDVRTGGRQTIHDAGNQIDLATEFVKIPGGDHGGNWGVRIRGIPREDAAPDLKTTVIFHASMEGLGTLGVANEEQGTGFEGTVTLQGQTVELGEFRLDITDGPETNRHPPSEHPSSLEKPLDRTLVHSLQLPEDVLWQTKPILFADLKQVIEDYVKQYGQENMPPPWQTYTIKHAAGGGNLHLIQKVFQGAFEFDVLYSSDSSPKPMSSENLSEGVSAATASFSKRFSDVLKPKAPFTKGRYEEFGKSLLSNLIGGIGYFHGDALVDRSYAPEYEEENEGFWEETAEARSRNQQKLEGPSELFTCIPSRPFFPRGFLWDEGFHLLPVADWDIDLTLEIIKSWFNLMDEDGWIAREQILGAEARSKVPQEFQVQYPHYANPPTLFLVLSEFIRKLETQPAASSSKRQTTPTETGTTLLANRPAALQYLRDLYPLLKRHYFWFRRTQRGDIKSYDREAFSTKEAYRWRGRTPSHILTSGLDDYPRAQPPHPGELHVDLVSWVGMMTRSLAEIAGVLGEEEDEAEFRGYETAILRNIDDLHWSEEAKTYCDATIDAYEESTHVCHKGYLSVFPFLTGLLPPDSPRLGAVLDLLADPQELWSPHGLRSLSQRDEFFGTGENYWRGPVWVNMNYLAVERLLNLAQAKGPHQKRATKLYMSLRKNLVETVYKSWEGTGFAWEQYNPDTGKGQRTQHFTGWTSLVVKIMAMPGLGTEGVRDEL